MMCAVRAAERHHDKRVVILEKADRVGKKLLITGNGRCNLTNTRADSSRYHGEGSESLINILFKKYSSKTVLRVFRDMGLLTRADSEGRVYPLSNSANSVLDVLRKKTSELDVEERCSVDVRAINKSGSGYEIITADAVYYAEKLIIAVGGKADYAGRISGGVNIAEPFGLKTTPLTPSLSPIKVKSDILPSLKGVRAEAEASLFQNGRLIKSERGEVQFADNSLSGICIFDLSREANKNGGEIRLDLLPDMTLDEVSKELSSRIMKAPLSAASDIFTGIFRKNIGMAVLKKSGIRPGELCNNISDKEINKLVKNIKALPFTCVTSSDHSKAQVTAGGIRLSEIDPYTFESKKHKGLYIIGEALDVDGDCGGYNLQFAWASALAAGDSL